MLQLKNSCIILIVLISSYSCKTKPAGKSENKFSFTVQQAPEWSALFKRNRGWFGGDGIFAASINGNEQPGAAEKDSSFIWFSDTMLGYIINDSLQPGFSMINNSIAVIGGAKPDSNAIRFYWNNTTPGKDAALFTPKTSATENGEYYWLADGFVNNEMNKDLYIFGFRIKNIPGKAVFGFKQTGTTLIHIPAGEKPPFTQQQQIDVPFFQGMDSDSAGSFGAGILVNTKSAGAPNADGYLYIYGVRGKQKEVIAARVKPAAIELFDQWTFWNGKDWSGDLNSIQPVTDSASNELSVTPLEDGRYVMVFQKNGIEPMVALRVGNSPVGPFGAVMDVYDTKDDLKESPNLFSYNAKAHPIFSKPGELLISYNINSFDYNNDIKKFPQFYRPRFIKLMYK